MITRTIKLHNPKGMHLRPTSALVSLSKTFNADVFIIKDEAGGVPEAIQTKIFETNFSTKSKGEGFGIGLHIARIIIDQEFGGTLTLQSNQVGSEFIIKIPRTDLSNLKFIR